MATSTEDETTQVTDEDILRVTDGLGPAELHHLFDRLLLPKHKVEIAEKTADSTCVILKARAVLRWWRKEYGSTATRKALFDAKDELTGKSREAAGGSNWHKHQNGKQCYIPNPSKVKDPDSSDDEDEMADLPQGERAIPHVDYNDLIWNVFIKPMAENDELFNKFKFLCRHDWWVKEHGLSRKRLEKLNPMQFLERLEGCQLLTPIDQDFLLELLKRLGQDESVRKIEHFMEVHKDDNLINSPPIGTYANGKFNTEIVLEGEQMQVNVVNRYKQVFHERMGIPKSAVNFTGSGTGSVVLVFLLPCQWSSVDDEGNICCVNIVEKMKEAVRNRADWLLAADIVGIHIEGEPYVDLKECRHDDVPAYGKVSSLSGIPATYDRIIAAAAKDDTTKATEVDIHKVTEEDIRKVTAELDPDELDHLFANLGIPQYMISHAKKITNTDDTILQARTVLYMWRKRVGNNLTRETLFNERDNILEKRKGKFEGNKEEFNLSKCQDQLREFYLGPDMKVQLTPWDPDHSLEMDAIFVNLNLEKVEAPPSQRKQIPIERNEDLVTLKTSTGIRINRILLLGEPGSGKTTLLNNIAYKWALQLGYSQSNDSPLSQFDLVFVINIHEIYDLNNTLEKIIFNQILEECPNVSQRSLKSYLKSHPQRCLILVDGLNEDSVGILNSSTAEISRVLYNKVYRQCCVIASSSPSKLHAMGSKRGIFTQVKLTEFSDENIEEYIRKFFPETNNRSLLQRLKEDTYVWHLAGTPLFLMFLCLLWDDSEQTKRGLPNTGTQIYQEIIIRLWKRYHYDKLGVSRKDVASDELKRKLWEFLIVLGQVSLNRLLLGQNMEEMLYNDNDFEEKTLSTALKVGFLSKERIRSKLRLQTKVKFVHTSFQDFCSAVYLANLHFDDIEKCKEYVAILIYPAWTPSKQRRDNVLIFCAGLRSKITKLMTRLLVNYANIYKSALGEGILRSNHIAISEHYSAMHVNFLFILAYEAQLTFGECNELVRIMSTAHSPWGITWMISHKFEACIQYQLNLLRSVTDTNTGNCFGTLSIIQFSDTPIEFPRFYQLILAVLKYTKQLSYLYLKFKLLRARNQVFHLSDMFDILARLDNLQALRLERDVNINSIRHGDVDITLDLHKICHLKLYVLVLMNVTVTAKSMAQFLRSSKSLKVLYIATTDSIMYDTLSMMKAISNIQTLSHLSLSGVVIGRGVKSLKSVVPQLNSLLLRRPSFDVWDVHELASYLQNAKKLTELGLSDIFLDTATCNLADQLKHLVNLKALILAGNELDNNRCQILADGIQTMRSLKSINLKQNPSIGLKGRLVINNLRTLRKFKHLEIEFDPIPQEAHVLQAQAPQHFQTAVEAGLYLKMEMGLLLTLMQQLEEIELQLITESQTPALPNCCSCMSQIYNDVTCKMSSTKSSMKDMHNISEVFSDRFAEDFRLPARIFKQNQPPFGQEIFQCSFLPHCCSCMTQIYNNVTCKYNISQVGKMEEPPTMDSILEKYERQASSGYEFVQTSFLPDCCNCMSKIYNDVTCKMSIHDHAK